jgi:hypothetical protein
MNFHLSTNISGAIKNGAFLKTIAEQQNCKPKQVKLWLLSLLDQGHRLLKDSECDNFDPEKGCLGHK